MIACARFRVKVGRIGAAPTRNDREGRTYANFASLRAVRASPRHLTHFRGRENIEKPAVAIYHLSVKTISRSAGRTATAAAAYRAGAKIEDEATGEIHDYRRKQGVEAKMLVLPPERPEWAASRANIWNKAEAAETRKNSTVAREIVIALPSELNPAQRKQLAGQFAQMVVNHHQCAADVAIHAPGKEGDHRNYHAHILLTTRRMTREGFSEKTRELDDKKRGPMYVKHWREQFAELQNAHLAAAGHSARVDHRTLEAQGIERQPTKHLGVHATAIERKTGQPSRRRIQHNEEVSTRLVLTKAIGDTERSIEDIKEEVILLNLDLAAAKQVQSEKAQADALYKSRAEAIRSNENVEVVLKKHPELAGAIATLRVIELKAQQEGLNPAQCAIVMKQVRSMVVDNLEKGHLPKMQIKEEKQVERDRELD